MTALLPNRGDGRFTRDQERKHLHHGHDSPEASPLGCAWEDPHLEIMAVLSESGWKRKGPAGHRDIQQLKARLLNSRAVFQNNCRGRTVPLPTGTYQRTLRERDRVPRYEPSSSLMKTLLQQEALR